MDPFNPIPSPAKTPGSVDPIPMDISAPSTPLGGGPPSVAPLSVPSLPGTPLVFTPTIGGGGGMTPVGGATSSQNMSVNSPIAARIGIGNDGDVMRVEMPSTPFQYQASPSGAGQSNMGGPSFSFAPQESSSSNSSNVSMESAGFALSDLLMQLEDFTPTLPDSIANYYLHQAGFESVDPRMSRLLSVATQKFISDLLNEAFTHCKLKGQANQAKTKVKDKRYVLTMEDLILVLNEHGITIRKPPYYT